MDEAAQQEEATKLEFFSEAVNRFCRELAKEMITVPDLWDRLVHKMESKGIDFPYEYSEFILWAHSNPNIRMQLENAYSAQSEIILQLIYKIQRDAVDVAKAQNSMTEGVGPIAVPELTANAQKMIASLQWFLSRKDMAYASPGTKKNRGNASDIAGFGGLLRNKG